MTELEPEKDQHLLADKEILELEVKEANLDKNDKIIEIGAGTGNLTKELVKAGKILAFEIDEKFKPELEKLKNENPNLELVFGNALNYSWQGHNKIVSNMPYSISEPVIMKAISSNISELIMIVSESFKNVLQSKSKLGFISSLFFRIKPITEVKRESFFPVPRTDSWLIKLKRKRQETKTGKILKNFLEKQGKIKNALLYSLVKEGKTKNQAREIISSLKIHHQVLEKPVKKVTSRFLVMLKENLEKIF